MKTPRLKVALQSLLKTVLYRLGYTIKRLRPGVAVRAAGVGASGSVRSLLHAVDPYEDFEWQEYPFHAAGWGAESTAFRELLTELRPRLVIEVGTWKGASALAMAATLDDLSLPAQIVCVDTWLGALEFWTDQSDPERYGSLRLRHGYPSVYYQFLANVCHRGAQDRITPFPQTSALAALWFRMNGIEAGLIYLDASHEEEDVYADLGSYWPLVSPGGALFGDDFTWDGVRLAVTRFAGEQQLTVRFSADKWVLRKSKGVKRQAAS